MPVRITSKGQVTIPQAIRQQAGLDPACEVRFRLVGHQVILEKVDPMGEQRAEQALALLRSRRSRAGLNTEQILALSRGEPEP